MTVHSFMFGILLFAMLVSLCSALFKYKYLPLSLKAATWFLLFAFLRQIVTFIFLYHKQNNIFLIHIGVVTDATTLLLMYREMFKKHIEEKEIYVYRKIFIVLIALFAVFAVVNAICWQSLTTYPSYTRTALSIVIIVCSALHFYKYTYEPIPKETSELKDYVHSRVPLFWINMGLILFTSAYSLISLFGNVFFNNKNYALEAAKISIFQAAFSILLYMFIGIAFIKATKMRSQKKS